MNKILIFIVLCFTVFAGCNPSVPEEITFGQKQAEVEEVVVAEEIEKEETPPVRTITFGKYCSECSGRCAVMYHFFMCGGNANTLWADYTDSFWKGKGDSLVFETQIERADTAAWNAASEIAKNIPLSLFKTTEKPLRYGCPDCTDGCGIYFEMVEDTREGSKLHRFYIDYQTTMLEGEIKDFAECIKRNIKRMPRPK
jgi:hypothetical protein